MNHIWSRFIRVFWSAYVVVALKWSMYSIPSAISVQLQLQIQIQFFVVWEVYDW